MSEPAKRMIFNPEYLRRNLLVAAAVGANTNAKAALKRLQAQKRPAKWLVTYLEGIIERTADLPSGLVGYRSAVPNFVPRSEAMDRTGDN